MITYLWKQRIGVSHVIPLFAYTFPRKKKKRKHEMKMNKMDCINIIGIGIEIQKRQKDGRNGSDKITCVFRNLLE